ncbi:MAG: SbcC/MukB-like Walker B domain-containing protein, partial [Myxococcota bacterium]
EVEGAQEAASAATAAYEAAVGRSVRAAHAVTLAQAAWNEARGVRREHEEASAEAGRHQKLAHDLRANGFRAWLLRDAFEALVTGASARLGELSGRYALTFDPERREILVVDHDNADETRRADTLSGGETFLASLALALELSEQVQRTTGAVRLDSLFVDEGFGTLDPETLDTVASAIETLGATRRMVGIITHVAGLTERLPARLDVRKGPSGSTVTRVVP